MQSQVHVSIALYAVANFAILLTLVTSAVAEQRGQSRSPASRCAASRKKALTLQHFNACVRSAALSLYTDEDAWARALHDSWPAGEGDRATFVVQTTGGMATLEFASAITSKSSLQLSSRGFAPPDLFFISASATIALSLIPLDSVATVEPLPFILKMTPEMISYHQAHEHSPAYMGQVLVELLPRSCSDHGTAASTLSVGMNSMMHKHLPDTAAWTSVDSDELVSLHRLKGSESTDALLSLSADPDVLHIEVMPNFTLLNKDTPWIVQSGQPGVTPAWDAGLKGADEIVGVADSGLDDDSCFFKDNLVGVQRNAAPNFTHRKIVSYYAYADGAPTSYSDHGTHVCGTLAGASEDVVARQYNGMASDAKIAFFDIGSGDDAYLRVPSSLYQGMFPFAKEAGAAIHTNSWGSDGDYYSMHARDVDAYSFENEEFLIVIAGGNDGRESSSTVRTPANAKNAIAVGASGGCVNCVASFSSRGPTFDGRIKPDIMAPGASILSADSSRTCDVTSNSGTSMAAPVVAAAAAMVRQYFRQGFFPSGSQNAETAFNPSGALVKAMLIHAGQPMAGAAGNFPGMTQGFGILQLERVLRLSDVPSTMDKTLWIRATKVGDKAAPRAELTQGASYSQIFTIAQGGRRLKATLVWMDPPASAYSRSALVNDLDLTITGPDGRVFFPNSGTARDSVNNVEMIRFIAEPGNYTVTVRATRLIFSPQPYALVVTGMASRVSDVEPVIRTFIGPFIGMGITGYNDIAFFGDVSAEACLALCRQRLACSSVDYGSRGQVRGDCWLSTATRETAGGAYTTWDLYDFYEIQTTTTSTATTSTYPFTTFGFIGPFVGKGITGYNDLGFFYGLSIENCLSLCRDAPTCSSIDYGARGDVQGQCILSTANREKAGNAYTTWPSYDYYEVLMPTTTAVTSPTTSTSSTSTRPITSTSATTSATTSIAAITTATSTPTRIRGFLGPFVGMGITGYNDLDFFIGLSIEDCLYFCRMGPSCSSVDYGARGNARGQCILSTATRATVGDAYTTWPSYDYYEVLATSTIAITSAPASTASATTSSTTFTTSATTSSKTELTSSTITLDTTRSFLGPFVGMGITGYNDLSFLEGFSIADCLSICREEPACASVDYGARGNVQGQCILSTATRETVGVAYTTWELYDYYEVLTTAVVASTTTSTKRSTTLSFLRPTSTTSTTSVTASSGTELVSSTANVTTPPTRLGFLGPFVGMGITGYNDLYALEGLSIEFCLVACQVEPACASVDYGARGNVLGQCILSTATREAAGSAYTVWTLYDYYEVLVAPTTASTTSATTSSAKLSSSATTSSMIEVAASTTAAVVFEKIQAPKRTRKSKKKKVKGNKSVKITAPKRKEARKRKTKRTHTTKDRKVKGVGNRQKIGVKVEGKHKGAKVEEEGWPAK